MDSHTMHRLRTEHAAYTEQRRKADESATAQLRQAVKGFVRNSDPIAYHDPRSRGYHLQIDRPRPGAKKPQDVTPTANPSPLRGRAVWDRVFPKPTAKPAPVASASSKPATDQAWRLQKQADYLRKILAGSSRNSHETEAGKVAYLSGLRADLSRIEAQLRGMGVAL